MIWPWFKMRWIALILKHVLSTQNIIITCVEDFLCESEVKNFAKNGQTPKLAKFKIWTSKMVFEKPTELGFWLVELCLCIFKYVAYMKTMFRVQAIFWYNSEYHKTRRNDFSTAESYFCRFLEIHTPKLWIFKSQKWF